MPKILDAPKEHIIAAAREELLSEGVKGFNIRPVAKNSGVAIGTIYNYYGNKTSLIVAVILDNWKQIKKELDAKCHDVSKEEAVRLSYDAIAAFHEGNKQAISEIFEVAPDCFSRGRDPEDAMLADVKAIFVGELGVTPGRATLAAKALFLGVSEEEVTEEEAKAVALATL
ncbi:MAG: TetR/AcrR family transcriptional regulator [Bacillota bacterium]|nr:TetR/AcrR family transcriptional regulator [Bacillota bacterium]